MTRYIAEFLLDSDIRIPDELPSISWIDPDGDFEIILSNQQDRFSYITEALKAHLVFDAVSLSEARERCEDILASVLNALVWTSLSMIRQAKLMRVVDWSPGKTMREALFLQRLRRSQSRSPCSLPNSLPVQLRCSLPAK